MLKLLISALACLVLSLFTYSQDDHLLWLEGRILESNRDTVTCDIYIYDRKSEEWMYMISYNYSGSYAVSFDYHEYYALVFSDSNTQYKLHIPVEGKGFKVVDIGLDVDVNAMLRAREEDPSEYVLTLMD